MNRPQRKFHSSSSFIIAGNGTFDSQKQLSEPIDYNDMDRHHQPHPPHNLSYPYHPTSPASSQSHNYHPQHHNQPMFHNNHHGISNNNAAYVQMEPNPMNLQAKHHYPAHNYPNYPNYPIDQHLPSTYRSTLREQPPSSSSPSSLMMESNSVYKILCITNISPEISDGPVKDAISNEFSRFGDISISVCHDGGERLVYIYFRTFEEAREARHSKLHTILFDRPIEIEPIYEPRPSPILSPQAPIFPTRRKSVTPPDYYPDNGHHLRRPPGPPVPAPAQHESPPGYPPYSARYSNRSAHPISAMHQMTNTMPYPDRHYPEPNQYPPMHHPPYHSPPSDHRQYPSNSPLTRYSPTGPTNSVPPYGPYKERDRPHPESYHTRGSRPAVDHYHGPEQRSYPPAVYPRGPIPPAGGHSHVEHPAHFHHRPTNIPSGRRSPTYPYPPNGPPYNRFPSRDFRREKFRENHLYEREESKPSRVIFITNIDPSKTESDIREMFEVFGIIEDLEVKKISSDLASAIIRFSSMDCAYRAKTSMNGKYIGSTKSRISYGKVNASRRLWLGGLGPTSTVELLDEEFAKFGDIISLDYVSGRPYGYIEYETPNQAQFAVMHLKGTLIAGADKRIRMEYVDSSERKEGSVKNESNSQTSSKTSHYRGNEIWNNNDSEICEQIGRKRSMSPTDNNPKRVSTGGHDLTDTGYFDRANRASTSSLTKSSNRSSPSSPALERSNTQDAVCDEYQSHKDSLRSEHHTQQSGPDNQTIAEKILQSRSIGEIINHCEYSLSAQLILRNFNFPSILHMCSGQQHIVDKYIYPAINEQFPVLRITQRWRLHPQPKLEEVKRHMQSGNLGIFIIKSRTDNLQPQLHDTCKTPQENSTPTSKQNGEPETTISEKANLAENNGTQPRPLKNLISYLEQKDAAGVVSVTCNDGDSHDQKLLYTFPPCEFALNILKSVAPKISSEELLKDEFLIGILVGTIETKV